MQLTECESLLDLANPPDSWQGVMEATVEGAIDYDDARLLAITCAWIAGPLWSKQVEQRLETLHDAHVAGDTIPQSLRYWFIGMGSKADLTIPLPPRATCVAHSDATTSADIMSAVDEALDQ